MNIITACLIKPNGSQTTLVVHVDDMVIASYDDRTAVQETKIPTTQRQLSIPLLVAPTLLPTLFYLSLLFYLPTPLLQDSVTQDSPHAQPNTFWAFHSY
jgi:hypothetical protein